MAYFGLVTRIDNVHKDENSDRLYLGECFNEGVIVGPDIKTGDLVLYLPQDGKIERWFGDKFTLFRKNEDGTPQGGYIDDNGHIRAIKLRGNQSSGVVISYERVKQVFPSVSWEAGDKVNEIAGRVFCSKYVPRGTKVQTSNKKTSYKGRKAEGITYPEFSMHSDTQQLAYNLDAFKPGDQINLTLKMHGCFIKNTKVRMADNTLKSIQNIHEGDMVLGYDLTSKQVVPTKVVHTFKNAPSSKWNQVKFSRNGIRGDKRGTQTSTWNHKYWVEEKQQWIMAKDLQIGETVSTLFPSPILNNLQKEIAIGAFLGDGCLLGFNQRTAEIQISHGKNWEAYVDYLCDNTSNWIYKEKEKTSGYGSTIVPCRSVRSADLFNFMNDCTTWSNQTGTKRLKPGIIDKITPLSIAIWCMDNGSIVHSENNNERFLLAICSFTDEEDLDIIDRCFKKYNITPTFYRDTEGYNRIRFNMEEAEKLFNLICTFVPPVMQYKIPKRYWKFYVQPKDISCYANQAYIPNGYVLSPQTVLENISINKEYDEYDLETELHNYIVGMTIVHNTSQRSMKTYAVIPNGFFRRLFHMKPKTKEAYVCGTRRCVVTENSNGYYGNDAFRLPHHERIKPFVDNGMEIFYEVVGYYGESANQTIMPIADNRKINDKNFVKTFGKETVFSYGCQPGQSDMYVYRITANNGEIEYTPEQITEWCAKAGVNRVPVIDNFTFTTVEDLQNRINTYFEDLVDPIGKTHVKEGVVVRIVNRLGFSAYKSKTWEFRVLEGIIKDGNAGPDIEEAQDEIAENEV